MHEVVTVQIGRRANYLCTHFWNTQESYFTFPPAPASPVNHDVHFRQGIGPDGTDTYLPRTLIYDVKAGFGSLARINALGALEEEATTDTIWNGAFTRLPPVPQSEPSPYALSLLNSMAPVPPTPTTTRYFADFASTFYHPRSLIPITLPFPTLDHEASAGAEISSFSASGQASSQSSSFEAGVDLFEARDTDVDVLDTDLRPWIEECDALQAVQLFTSYDDAWAGFATKYVEKLRDELGKGCIWVWGLDGSLTANEQGAKPRTRTQQHEQTMNTALALQAFGSHASMFIPLSVPNSLPNSIHLNRTSLWHTTGLLNAVVESASIPTRLREINGHHSTFQDWQDVLGAGGRRTIANVAWDLNVRPEQNSEDTRMQSSGAYGEEDLGNLPADAQFTCFPMLEAARGGSSRIASRRSKTFARIECFRSKSDDVTSVLANGGGLPSDGGVILERYHTPLEFPLLSTFPPILSVVPVSDPRMPLHTSLSTSSSIADWTRSIGREVKGSLGGLLGREEKEALVNSLGEIAETYIEDWESAGDSDDD